MKTNLLLIIQIIMILVGFALLVWGNIIVWNYDGYREIFIEARNEALPQLIGSISVFVLMYMITFIKTKK